jgi:hypothetical protein
MVGGGGTGRIATCAAVSVGRVDVCAARPQLGDDRLVAGGRRSVQRRAAVAVARVALAGRVPAQRCDAAGVASLCREVQRRAVLRRARAHVRGTTRKQRLRVAHRHAPTRDTQASGAQLCL